MRDSLGVTPTKASMSGTSAFAAILALLAVGSAPAASSAQSPTIARPGNDIVSGASLTDSRREFAISSSAGCELANPVASTQVGTLVQVVRVIGDTAVLIVREWHRPESPVLDTTALDRRTLAPLWSHAHFQQGASASWEFRGRRVLWSALQPGHTSESVDSTLEEPAFLAGATDLLLAASSRLYDSGAVILFSFVDLDEGPGQRTTLALDTVAVRVTGSEVVRLPSGKRIDAWVVKADQPPGGGTYWIDKGNHEVLKWYVPQYESICPTTYLRLSR
jgi:hypothetical protein